MVSERTTSRLDEDSLAHSVLDKSRGCVDVICKECLRFASDFGSLHFSARVRGLDMECGSPAVL